MFLYMIKFFFCTICVLFSFFLELLEPILQDLFNGRDLDCRKNEETTKTKETLHVIKAMLCIFEGLETNVSLLFLLTRRGRTIF